MATYIGIDVGKKSLQVYLPCIDKSLDITNNEAGFIKLTRVANQGRELESRLLERYRLSLV